AAIHATTYDSRAAAGRHPQAPIAEISDRALHRDVQPLGDPADLLPQSRRVSLERALRGTNVEPPRQPHLLAAEKRLALARRRAGISLRAADLVRRAATLHRAGAKRRGSGRHPGASGGSTCERVNTCLSSGAPSGQVATRPAGVTRPIPQ